MSASISLTEHFARLFDFRGREDRASFWRYAAVTFVIVMIAGLILFVPMMSRAIQAMRQFAAQHPEQATVTSGPGQFMDAASIARFLAVTFGLAILLYAAAVVRRLHDRGKSGLWGLMPLPFIIYSSVQMPRILASVGTSTDPDTTLFFSIILSNLFYIITSIWLIIMLAAPSESAPNRYSTTL